MASKPAMDGKPEQQARGHAGAQARTTSQNNKPEEQARRTNQKNKPETTSQKNNQTPTQQKAPATSEYPKNPKTISTT